LAAVLAETAGLAAGFARVEVAALIAELALADAFAGVAAFGSNCRFAATFGVGVVDFVATLSSFLVRPPGPAF